MKRGRKPVEAWRSVEAATARAGETLGSDLFDTVVSIMTTVARAIPATEIDRAWSEAIECACKEIGRVRHEITSGAFASLDPSGAAALLALLDDRERLLRGRFPEGGARNLRRRVCVEIAAAAGDNALRDRAVTGTTLAYCAIAAGLEDPPRETGSCTSADAFKKRGPEWLAALEEALAVPVEIRVGKRGLRPAGLPD